MKYRWIRPIISIAFLIILAAFIVIGSVRALPLAQQPTGTIPTVTSTPRGTYVIVNALTTSETQINVRAGPNALTEKVGVLLVGQDANAIGRYGEWIQIEYPGTPGGKAWIFGNYVTVYGGSLPLLEPPPTSTPKVTQTIDPTLAAQFLITPAETRLPTFTEPAPLQIPTYEVEDLGAEAGGLPMGLIIVGLASLGVFLMIIAIISGR